MNNKTEKESFYENGEGQLNIFNIIKITNSYIPLLADNLKLLIHVFLSWYSFFNLWNEFHREPDNDFEFLNS